MSFCSLSLPYAPGTAQQNEKLHGISHKQEHQNEPFLIGLLQKKIEKKKKMKTQRRKQQQSIEILDFRLIKTYF